MRALTTSVVGGESAGLGLQRKLSGMWLADQHRSLLSSLPDPGKARLRSCSGDAAMAWLNAAPSKALGAMSPSSEFRLAARFLLGLPLSSHRSHCLYCDTVADVWGVHQSDCTYSGHNTLRHSAIVNVIRSVAAVSATQPRAEAPFPGCTGRDGGQLRGDILLKVVEREVMIDVAVTKPLQERYCEAGSSS